MNKIYFTADLHFGHTNVLKHCPERPYACDGDIEAHDGWLLDLWKSTVDKKDDIYILGDLTFLKSDDARHLLEKLPGRKFLVEGNHDGSIRSYGNYFVSVNQILDVKFSPQRAPILKDNLRVSMCHYPMVTWNHKPYGSIMLHGHCHGKLDEYNALAPDLRFDVGIDGCLSREAGRRNGDTHGMIPIELIYEEAVLKAKTSDFATYASANYRSAEK